MRELPKRFTKSASLGNFSPAAYFPDWMSRRSSSKTRWYFGEVGSGEIVVMVRGSWSCHYSFNVVLARNMFDLRPDQPPYPRLTEISAYATAVLCQQRNHHPGTWSRATLTRPSASTTRD